MLQYEALEKTYEYLLSQKSRILQTVDFDKTKRLVFIGCGSGYSLCQSAAMSGQLRLPVHGIAMAAGDLMINSFRYDRILENAVLVAPSRSGSTSEVLEAVKYAKSKGVPTIGIVAKSGSPLEDLADECFALPWAFDEAVCQTRTVTNLYAANLMIIGILARDDGLLSEIRQAIDEGSGYMDKWAATTEAIGQSEWSRVVVLADGELEGIAAEGALAFTEICQTPANYHHVLDVRHGPMVLIRSDTLVVMATTKQENTLQKQLVIDLRGRGAKVVLVGPGGEGLGANWYVATPSYENYGVTGIPFIYVPQTVGLAKAIALGINPDEPDGLDSWIELPSTAY